jgi:predicted RNA binding protein YcfA (HicA-like mRNA interferase family)
MEKTLQRDGWYATGQRGSHKHYKHPTKPGKITIPMGKKDLPTGTKNKILKDAGLK